ncbi:MAG: paaJ, partial [Sediminibacterium sp.]|nr:paaJ [Sediminibacterium sp.]
MNTPIKHISLPLQTDPDEARRSVWELLETVPDPEVPVLSVIDLGVVLDVVILSTSASGGRGVKVLVTPTYTGCPAMDMMKMNIRMVLLQAGFTNIVIEQVLSPAWTTDW